MKAAVIHQFGGPEVFCYEEVPEPQPGSGEVVVKVAACGINRYDLYLRMGAVFKDLAFPHVLGADVAGEVVAIGPQVSGFEEGDAVIISPGYPVDPADWSIRPMNRAPSFEVTGTHTWGGNAEYVRMPARFVLKDETHLPAPEVAAMPLVLMTAVHAVETLGQVVEGARVLVQAGASGSGHACIQVARVLGARVATTVGSPDKVDLVRAAGAELVINHRTQDFAAEVLEWTDGVGVDVVVDCVGGSVFAGNLKALRVGGIFVNFGLVGGIKAELNFRELFFRQLQLRGSFMGSTEELKRGLHWLAEGAVKAHVDRTYPLRDAAEAHRYIESRAVKGKVVLIP
ncbi:MAG TPA: zinc-binding dehydrogenase [Phycisphaerae bacterium]|nr:zinc-binding dehydrogenase [Phycisphaerae bacterium]HNU44333.1 zinc-binding dehydrogenase [Phycisphaerae bacterium]